MRYINSLWRMPLVLLVVIGAVAGATGRTSARLDEEFSFTMPDFKMEHQGEVNNLNLHVRFRYVEGIKESDYPDYRLLLKDVEVFLGSYQNERDYWEIVNKRMSLMLLRKYPALAQIVIEMRVSPSRLEPHNRASIVNCTRADLTPRPRRTGRAAPRP